MLRLSCLLLVAVFLSIGWQGVSCGSGNDTQREVDVVTLLLKGRFCNITKWNNSGEIGWLLGILSL